MSLTALQTSNVFNSEQFTMGQQPMLASAQTDELEHLLDTNCRILQLPSHYYSDDVADFRPALLQFMATATSDPELENDILRNFEEHKQGMTVTPVTHFAPSPGAQHVEFTVGNVPDAISPVKAKLAYIQVPNEEGDNTELHLVWKVSPTIKVFLSVSVLKVPF
jgi:extracellular elastinolytic metalloproteinase